MCFLEYTQSRIGCQTRREESSTLHYKIDVRILAPLIEDQKRINTN